MATLKTEANIYPRVSEFINMKTITVSINKRFYKI